MAHAGFEEAMARQTRKRNSSSLSYVAVIARAILSTPHQKLPLCEIYKFIEENHKEFTENRPRWKNTVRHNLSLHDCFIRGEMAFNRKGCNWRIHPSFILEFSNGDFSRHKFSQTPYTWEGGPQPAYASHPLWNHVSPCHMCESARQGMPSLGWLPFIRRQQESPQISTLPWRPWIYWNAFLTRERKHVGYKRIRQSCFRFTRTGTEETWFCLTTVHHS